MVLPPLEACMLLYVDAELGNALQEGTVKPRAVVDMLKNLVYYNCADVEEADKLWSALCHRAEEQI